MPLSLVESRDNSQRPQPGVELKDAALAARHGTRNSAWRCAWALHVFSRVAFVGLRGQDFRNACQDVSHLSQWPSSGCISARIPFCHPCIQGGGCKWRSRHSWIQIPNRPGSVHEGARSGLIRPCAVDLRSVEFDDVGCCRGAGGQAMVRESGRCRSLVSSA